MENNLVSLQQEVLSQLPPDSGVGEWDVVLEGFGRLPSLRDVRSLLSQRKIAAPENFHVNQGLITLGPKTWKANRFGYGQEEYWVCIKNKRSGLISLISGHSSGKSVLSKRLYAGIALCEPKRPGLIFDMQGLDHRFSKFPSAEGHGRIFESIGESRFGFGSRWLNITPAYLEHESPFRDRLFAISWRDLTEEEWDFLLSESSEAKSWKESFLWMLPKGMRECDTFERLISDIEDAAWSKPSERGGWIPKEISGAELKSMVKSLRRIQSKRYLVESDDPLAQTDIVELLEQRRVVNVCFHSDERTPTKLYTGWILRRVYEFYNRKAAKAYPFLIDAPWMLVEEFNKLSPSASPNQPVVETPGQKWIREIVTKGMKIGFKLMLIMQDAHDISSKMRRNIFNDTVLVCNLTHTDLKVLVERFGPAYKEVLQLLDTQFDENMTKEWALLDSGQLLTFRPGASPVEFHERFRKPKRPGFL